MNNCQHPLIEAAAQGTLPEWAAVSPGRRAHMARVSELLDAWAAALGLPESERCRWRAAGFLHDALREVAPDALRAKVPRAQSSLPGPILHGPAVAERLRAQGVLDGELLFALAYHTLGNASLGTLGRALYVADFLEPGRDFMPEWREGLRARMPAELDSVTREIVGARILYVVDRGLDLLPDIVEFWNVLVTE